MEYGITYIAKVDRATSGEEELRSRKRSSRKLDPITNVGH